MATETEEVDLARRKLQAEAAELEARVAQLKVDRDQFQLERDRDKAFASATEKKAQLEIDRAQLELDKERRTLERDELPWWTKSGTITSLVAIVGVLVPITTGSLAWIQGKAAARALEAQRRWEHDAQEAKERHEGKLEELRLAHSVATDFLDRMTTDAVRLRTLRLIEMTIDEPRLKAWAVNEKTILNQPVDTLQAKVDVKSKLIQEKNAQRATASDKQKAELSKDIDHLRRERDQLQSEKDARERGLLLPSPIVGTILTGRKAQCIRATNETVEQLGDIDAANGYCAGKTVRVSSSYRDWNDGTVSTATTISLPSGGVVWCYCMVQP